MLGGAAVTHAVLVLVQLRVALRTVRACSIRLDAQGTQDACVRNDKRMGRAWTLLHAQRDATRCHPRNGRRRRRATLEHALRLVPTPQRVHGRRTCDTLPATRASCTGPRFLP